MSEYALVILYYYNKFLEPPPFNHPIHFIFFIFYHNVVLRNATNLYLPVFICKNHIPLHHTQ